MGVFSVDIEVGDAQDSHFESIEAIVDTGVTYTSIPSDFLRRLGARPEEEAESVLANGHKATYGMAWVRVRLDGREHPTLVVLSESGSEVLLGAFTLEGFRLGVDAVNKRLVSTPGLLL